MSDVPVTYSAEVMAERASADVYRGLGAVGLWLGFAKHDIKQRFRRSVLGPFWITLSTAATIGALALVYSTIFPTPLKNLLPYLAIGLVTWGLINSCLVEGCEAFVWFERWIRNVPMPMTVHLLRLLARNVIVWAHNMLIVVILLIVFPPAASVSLLLVIPGLVLLLANLGWMSLVLAIVCARYRDVTQIVISVMQIVFFLTPIFWSVASASNRVTFVYWNPFYHLLEIVRSPLLGERPSPLSWIACSCLAAVGIPFAFKLYQRAHSRIPYWL